MISRKITLPELGLVAMTRAALGFGLGLLIADRMAARQRKAIGLTLFGFGVVTTIPLVLKFLHGKDEEEATERRVSMGGRRALREVETAETVESP